MHQDKLHRLKQLKVLASYPEFEALVEEAKSQIESFHKTLESIPASVPSEFSERLFWKTRGQMEILRWLIDLEQAVIRRIPKDSNLHQEEPVEGNSTEASDWTSSHGVRI